MFVLEISVFRIGTRIRVIKRIIEKISKTDYQGRKDNKIDASGGPTT